MRPRPYGVTGSRTSLLESPHQRARCDSSSPRLRKVIISYATAWKKQHAFARELLGIEAPISRWARSELDALTITLGDARRRPGADDHTGPCFGCFRDNVGCAHVAQFQRCCTPVSHADRCMGLRAFRDRAVRHPRVRLRWRLTSSPQRSTNRQHILSDQVRFGCAHHCRS